MITPIRHYPLPRVQRMSVRFTGEVVSDSIKRGQHALNYRVEDTLEALAPLERENLKQFGDDSSGPLSILEIVGEFRDGDLQKLKTDLNTKTGLAGWWTRRREGSRRSSAGKTQIISVLNFYHKSRHESVRNYIKTLSNQEAVTISSCSCHHQDYSCLYSGVQINNFGREILESGKIPAFREQIKTQFHNSQEG